MMNMKCFLTLYKYIGFNFSRNLGRNLSKYNVKNFSTISLITREGTVDRSENPNFNKTINWELSKVWINPHHNSFLNSMDKNTSFTNDTQESCRVVPVGPLIQQIDFDRFLRKMGLTLSREDSVYIQDGLYKGKKVRVVTSDEVDASNVSAFFEEKGDFLSADVHVLYLTDIAEVGTKRFVFYDKKNKVLISNTRNLENITSVIQDL